MRVRLGLELYHLVCVDIRDKKRKSRIHFSQILPVTVAVELHDQQVISDFLQSATIQTGDPVPGRQVRSSLPNATKR